jgi:hypothetical protein
MVNFELLIYVLISIQYIPLNNKIHQIPKEGFVVNQIYIFETRLIK